LHDLWEYSGGKWKRVSGSNAINASGSYGTKGIAAPEVPGARYAAISWIDPSGSLLLFGGSGYDLAGTQGGLNDLWEYTPSGTRSYATPNRFNPFRRSSPKFSVRPSICSASLRTRSSADYTAEIHAKSCLRCDGM
jgi:hypothetical protein